MRNNNHVTDLTHGNIIHHLISFSIPLMLGNLFQLSYNMVDTIVIGRFAGSVSLAAVGTCDQIMTLLILGVSGVCVGASVLMGHFFGAGDREQLLEEIKTTVTMGLLFSILVLAAGIPLSGVFFRLMQVQPEALADATIYLRVIFIGMPFTCLYNIYAAALRSVGDSRTPVRYLILSCVINTLLDLLLVAVFHLGVLGAALATAAAQGVSALLCILHVSRNVRELHFSWRKLGINKALAWKTLTYGGFSALQQCAQPIGNLIIQGSINTLGVTAAAAFSAARKIEDIGLLPGRSISVAMTSLIAQNVGAGEKKRVEQGFQKGMLLEGCSGLLVCGVVLLLRGGLMSLFSEDPEIIRAGLDYFQIISFCYFLPCLSNGMQGYFRGIGAMKTSLFATLSQISFRVVATLLLAPRIGISGVALACIIGWSAMLLWTIPWRRYLLKKDISFTGDKKFEKEGT